MKRLASTFAILAATVLLGSPAAAQAVAGEFGGITGTITDISGSTVLVEADPDETSGSDKSYVRVTPDTRITKQSGGDKAARFEDLAVGSMVRARFSGPVAESYPTQATAASIVILDGGGGELPDTGGMNPVLLGLAVLTLVTATGLVRGGLRRV